MVKIGVFDSGIGGQAVAERLQQLFPQTDIVFVSDSANVPYGLRSQAEIIQLTEQAIQPLLADHCDAIVIACNTATTNAISSLRTAYPDTHFVGIEPMVKPAAKMTKTGVIAVLATPGTLASSRYNDLKNEWATGVTIIEPDCSLWADLVEHGKVSEIDLQQTITDTIRHGADIIVLGCTHYHWLKSQIESIAGPNIRVLEPSDAIGARLESLLFTDSVLPE